MDEIVYEYYIHYGFQQFSHELETSWKGTKRMCGTWAITVDEHGKVKKSRDTECVEIYIYKKKETNSKWTRH